ncbi:Ribbon-helix-helix protein CopG domain-containing protein [Paraburkholderia sacchari]|uniref:plasmid mobilization protein n=1 Tax=Paraburkholderia sacchari TaxID=159450 RepID=UPI0039A5F0B3
MNKPSERIVVFVTPAQKRAISATADELGISISELMRRAVLAFSATSDQVKAASIVDRLSATREPDALAQVLRKAAKPLRTGRSAGLRPAAVEPAAEAQANADGAVPLAAGTAESAGAVPEAGLEPDSARAERALAQAVVRLSSESAEAAQVADAQADVAGQADAEPLQPLSGAPFARAAREDDDATHSGDAAPNAGKFA